MTDPKHTEPVDLLPCPFCGGEPRIAGMAEDYVECTECDATVGLDGNNPEGPIAAWNTRTAAEAASRAREARLRGVAKDALVALPVMIALLRKVGLTSGVEVGEAMLASARAALTKRANK